ncbi:hypothetical protein HPB48_004118 [Haemaphysalis longicornis]|uniref:SWIM-type domain-containing protein n=1 Tax=Haemaphysalis longicornis TaxID=44386 RepID=A0A9J6FV49_HAELO|nr:hypothetical protein HPB48_004118 [Haemaphysalis longicornis]
MRTSVVIQSDANITEAGCECRVGATGVCKHVAALLWLLLDAVLSDTHFVSETSCTESARSWKTGSKKSNVSHLEFSELNFVKHEPGKQKVFVPTTKQIGAKVTEDDLVGLHRALKKRKINPMLASVLEDASLTPQEIVSLPEKACTASLPIQLPTEVLWVEHVHSTYNNNNCALSVEEVWELEASTRLQSRSEVWHAERSKRLTASHFGEIVSRQKEVDKKFLSRVFGNAAVKTRHMSFGVENEEPAVARYIALKKGIATVYDCGLCVNPGVPVLAASPDRVVAEGDQFGLAEVKTLAA